MLPKLSVAGDLSCSSRQTVPDARSCDSKTSVAESGTCVRGIASVLWEDERGDDVDHAQRRQQCIRKATVGTN